MGGLHLKSLASCVPLTSLKIISSALTTQVLSFSQLVNGFFGISITEKTYLILPVTHCFLVILAFVICGFLLYCCAKARCNKQLGDNKSDEESGDIKIGDKRKEN